MMSTICPLKYMNATLEIDFSTTLTYYENKYILKKY